MGNNFSAGVETTCAMTANLLSATMLVMSQHKVVESQALLRRSLGAVTDTTAGLLNQMHRLVLPSVDPFKAQHALTAEISSLTLLVILLNEE